MKLRLLKALILVLYLNTLNIVWLLKDSLHGFMFLLVSFTLAYCGIIILSHLFATLIALCPWRVAASLEKQRESFSAPSVVFETETEAT